MTQNTKLNDFADGHDLRLLRLEPANLYDEALVGVVFDGGRARVVYDHEKVLELTMTAEGWTYEEAQEWFEYNLPDGAASPMMMVWRV